MRKIKIFADEITLRKVFDVLNIDSFSIGFTELIEIRFQASRKLEKRYSANLREDSQTERIPQKHNDKKGKSDE